MNWEIVREVINYSTPLAGLLAIGYGGYKAARWLAVDIINPVFGPDGVMVKFLITQSEEAEKQTRAMAELNASVREAGSMTSLKLDDIASIGRVSSNDHAKLHDEVIDLLQMQRHWADAASTVYSDNKTALEHIGKIRMIASKYSSDKRGD